MNAQQIIALGGKEWRSADGTKHRVYINADVAERLIDFEAVYYKTGNISGAWLNGVKISNGRGSTIASSLRIGKIWFDCATGEINSRGMGDTGLLVRAAIIKAVAAAEAAAPAPSEVAAILVKLMEEQAATGDMREAYDNVMGEGAYEKLAGEVYDQLAPKQ